MSKRVTFFGKFVDPLADKIMVMAILVYLTAQDRLPAWLTVLLLGREFYMSALRTLARRVVMTRAWIWQTRLSVTPSTAAISFISSCSK